MDRGWQATVHEVASVRHNLATIHGILQARILEWVAFPFSRESSQGIEPRSPALQVDSLPAEPQGKSKKTGVGSLPLLQRIFLTQELNWGLLHCRQILYQLSYQGCKWPFFLYPLWSLLHTGGYRERGSKLSGFSSFKTF